jgi:uncharacterized protein
MNRPIELIKILNLEKHPEGGFYREVYRAGEEIKKENLPERFSSDCAYSTLIYYLLQNDEFSAFHRIKSDEIWHFYEGSTLNIYILQPSGQLEIKKLGNNPDKGESFFCVVPANCWFSAQLESKKGYVLGGCSVSPGFNFSDFEMADKKLLIEQFPACKDIIENLSR